MNKIWVFVLSMLVVMACDDHETRVLKKQFRNPPNEFRPMPFWHINGKMTAAGIEKRITDARSIDGFGGVTVLPVTAATQWGTKNLCPGTEPPYLSIEYFDRYTDILTTSEKLGMQVILYDDIDFPSGSAGGRLQKEYPEYTQKYLVKEETWVTGKRHVKISYPKDKDYPRTWMVVSALDSASKTVVDLQPFIKDSVLEWNAPEGRWCIMFIGYQRNNDSQLVDFMQPEAVAKEIEMTYGEYEKRYQHYFGNVITKTFFDDVGFVHNEEMWTPAITEQFVKKYGKNPALYYPALYYDIGTETQAARVAFYDTRAELMAEGYVKQVAEWAERNHLKSMGHPPENYSPNSVVANGDILKYYRHTQIPLLDAIFSYGRGLHGFKQVSSAADRDDKPMVGAELCGAFPADMDSLTLYRVVMEAMARGVNFVVPHGMWYLTDADKIRIPPLISHENPLLKDALPDYSAFVGRSCLMLQGGRRVSDIAVLWPINAIQAESYINRDKNSGLPVANWLPKGVNHPLLSNLLTNVLRRDFTYIHPEDLCNGKISIEGKELTLNNKTNIQHYKVLIMPGGDVISADALHKICEYLKQGGRVIATGVLPTKSAEFGKDEEVRQLVQEMMSHNDKVGRFDFIANISATELERVLNEMDVYPDVDFDDSGIPTPTIGYLNYIHKQVGNRNVYFFTNTTDGEVSTTIRLRGNLHRLTYWDPHTGRTKRASGVKHTDIEDRKYTELTLHLPSVSSLFVVGQMSE